MRFVPRLASLVVFLLLLGPAVARAGGPLIVNGAGTPLVWSASPVPFNPDQGPLGVLPNATAVGLVESLFGVWDAVPTASVTTVDAGPLPVDVTVANYPLVVSVCGDGLSPIIFDTDGSITDDLFGFGASDNILGFAGPDCISFVPPVIEEGLAVLNGKWIDGIPPTEISVDEFSGVFVHEFGHYLGLDHSQINLVEGFDGDPSNDEAVATMFPFLIEGAASLHLDDIVSISTLYPDASFAADFGSISGTIRLPDGAGQFQGAHVVARSLADPRLTAVGMASGADYSPFAAGGPPPSSLQGAFVMRGLPPGSYTVEIEEIAPFFVGGSSVGPLDPPAVLPGPPEFYNGADEAATDPPDDPAAFTPVAVTAGQTVTDVDIVINPFPPPPNDACDAATVIPALPFADAANTVGATTDPSDPAQSCAFGSHGVWYAVVAPADGVLHVSTAGSSYDTVLSAYTGTCGALTEVGCNDDAAFDLTSDLQVVVTAGETLRIEATGYGSASGRLELNAEMLVVYPGTYDDPVGDTFGTFQPQIDLTRVSACRTRTELRIGLEFAGPIRPASSGAPNALGGYIDLDVDQNPATGITPFTDIFSGGSTGLGTDYFVSLFSASSPGGAILIFDGFFNQVGQGAVTFGPTSASIRIPLQVLDNDDGNVSLAALVGTFTEPTDGAPTDGSVASVECVGVPSCGASPRAGCKKPVTSGKAVLKLLNKQNDAKDAFTWNWAKGAGTLKPDFGDPTRTNGYSLCVYDDVEGTPGLAFSIDVPPGGTCEGKPCWSATESGFKYKSKRTANPDGLERLVLKEGVGGKATIQAKASGPNVTLPRLPFSQAPTVTVQLLNLDGFCWDADFSAPGKQNDGDGFLDKGD